MCIWQTNLFKEIILTTCYRNESPPLDNRDWIKKTKHLISVNDVFYHTGRDGDEADKSGKT